MVHYKEYLSIMQYVTNNSVHAYIYIYIYTIQLYRRIEENVTNTDVIERQCKV